MTFIARTTLMLLFCLAPACFLAAPGNGRTFTDGAVTIEDKGAYYLVTIDYTGKVSPREAGAQYGRCILAMEPGYAGKVGYYMFEIATLQGLWGGTITDRMALVRPQVDNFYRAELEGLGSVLKGAWGWTPEELVFGFNLLPDLFRTSQCSAFGCWGDASATGSNITYRTLDWFGGLFANELPSLQAVTRIRYPGYTIYLIGALGHLGCVTGISLQTGILAGILDANVTDSPYNAAGCRSYCFDLRRALEMGRSAEGIAELLTAPSARYSFSHLVVIGDEWQTRILENNISGKGDHPRRALRCDTSALNPTVYWDHPGMIAAVNCFMLRGQVDNYTTGEHAKINTGRWLLLLKALQEKLGPGKNKLAPGDVREIMCSFRGKEPGSLLLNQGDLYNLQTQQMMLYEPAKRSLKVFMKPKSGANPPDPLPWFVDIPLEP